MAATTKEIAASKYAAKVCGYLGVEETKCKRLFDKLYENMKKAISAIPA
jgi:hypothetical protein